MKVAVIFDRFGPYHVARLKAASKLMDILPIEVSAKTIEYEWDEVQDSGLQNRVTLFHDKASSVISAKSIKDALAACLGLAKPDVVAINGWYDTAALTALLWCRQNRIPSIVMSDSTAIDSKRSVWKEFIKASIVREFDCGFVAGIRHADYLQNLGISKENIFFGYDVVDNNYFDIHASKIRDEKSVWQNRKCLPERFFLVVSRFIEKKNLPFIINAYNRYYNEAGTAAWHLCILGDGPQKQELYSLTTKLGLSNVIHFEGFKQYNELPVYFGLASVFVHASTSEQWGLVVNEAMASGLPVIVSERCGCVPELVDPGINGYTFNPFNEKSLTDTMLLIANTNQDISIMGEESKKKIAAFNPLTFGQGLFEAAECAVRKPKRKFTLSSKILLKTLISR